MGTQLFSGLVADVINDRLFPGTVVVQNGRIAAVAKDPTAPRDRVIAPGFVDAHVHVESSLLAPAAFGRAAVVHGTVATVSDPHEIANVLGVAGVLWMLENARHSPIPIHFGAPSCVPATPFETAGADFGAAEVETLLSRPEISYLAEVMNFPGVLAGDPKMRAILAVAKRLGKRVDGHAPGVTGDALARYAAAGIETDHECVTLDEARQRAALGMFVAIREGSAARNFDALAPLLRERPEMCFLCSDDKHPDELLLGHINSLVARAIAAGARPLDALRAATLNPVRHYRLNTGLLRAGDPADFVILNSLEECRVLETWLHGELAAKDGTCVLPPPPPLPASACPNKFNRPPVTAADFAVPAPAANARDAERVWRVQKMAPVADVPCDAISPEDAHAAYKALLPAHTEDGETVQFVHAAYGKLIFDKRRELTFKVVPYLKNILEKAVFAYAEPERNPEKHTNMAGFKNYVAKINIGEIPYYVRFHVQIAKPDNHQFHGLFVSDIEITKAVETDVLTQSQFGGNPVSSAFVDKRLLEWFASVKPRVNAIVALDGQLLTGGELVPATLSADGAQLVADPARDLLKIVVVNRYTPDAPPAVAFIKNFGLRRGALASSVAHDSHNIVAVGADDASLAAAVNAVIAHKGGLSFADAGAAATEVLPLPVAGLMSNADCATAAAAFTRLNTAAAAAGCSLRSPYMTLSFMALLVIPQLKLSDRGLFDVSTFAFTPAVL